MMDSILTSVKKMLGIVEEYEHFDADLIMHINTVLSILTQLGVGPSEGFTIEDKSQTWSDFVRLNSGLDAVKSFVYLKVRLLFDPPLSSGVTESINRMVGELEWRLKVAAEEAQSKGGEGIQNG